MQKCKRCLLREAGEEVTFREITAYLESIKDELTDEITAERRLAFCRECDSLLSGMCLKCGCYVEVRARLKNGECPKEKF